MNAINKEEFTKILDEANIKLRLKRELRFVPEEINGWEDYDFIAIMNRSRSEGVIVVPFDKMRVVPFELQKMTANKETGRKAAIICDICATWRRGSEAAVISVRNLHDRRISTSFLCCEDLLCSLHIRNKTPAAMLSRTQLREQITDEARIARLQVNLRKIIAEAKR
jgi:hypothetical protein